MKSLFSAKHSQSRVFTQRTARENLIRQSTGLLKRLPPAAAPIAVTLVGGLGIVVAFAALLGQQVSRPGTAAPATINEAIAIPDKDAAAPSEEKNAMTATDIPAATKASELASASAAAETMAEGSEFNRDASTDGEITTAAASDSDGNSVDASIMRQADKTFAPTVAVAETPSEILKLEAIQRREVEADIGTPSNEKTAAIPPASPPKVAAIATKWVNMRAGPSDDAKVLIVVPALAGIKAESACNWCAVTYDGHQGYIYKTFISYE